LPWQQSSEEIVGVIVAVGVELGAGSSCGLPGVGVYVAQPLPTHTALSRSAPSQSPPSGKWRPSLQLWPLKLHWQHWFFAIGVGVNVRQRPGLPPHVAP
jgi:hypothetical protein